jgi:hypothetical protein
MSIIDFTKYKQIFQNLYNIEKLTIKNGDLKKVGERK